MVRIFGHGELHLALLALLRRREMHGYELMTGLEHLLGSRYRPSAGSVYPALSALVAEGLLERRRDGHRQRYMVTPAGRAALDARAGDLAALEIRTGVRFDGASRVDGDLARFGARITEVAPFVDADEVAGILDAAALEVERLVSDSAHQEEIP